MANFKGRSKLELRVQKNLEFRGIKYKYESRRLKYYPKPAYYTPDIELENGVLVEIKGYFPSKDRTKMLLVREANPDLDIRILFQNNPKIHKNSKMRYSDWAEKHGFTYAVGEVIPDEWLR